MKEYKFLPHTADVKFQAFGKNLQEIFENSVLAVSSILSKGQKIKPARKTKITLEGEGNETLLYSLIEEVIYLFDAEDFIVAKAKVDFNEKLGRMNVVFYGDDSKKYEGLDHIKAATYSDMYVKNLGKKEGWEAQVVVDV